MIAVILTLWKTADAETSLATADALYKKGGVENYLAAITQYEQALTELGETYESLWKSARIHREYGNSLKQAKAVGWEESCAQHGKSGMQFAEQAITLNPSGVEGYCYYGLSVGIYADGVSILTALSEGLKGKAQKNLETAYKIDPTYEKGGPILALGRFWAVLPWPMTDKKKALGYYREFQKAGFLDNSAEGQIYLAELLLATGGQDNKDEAKKLLEFAVKSPSDYFSQWATQLLAELEK